MDPPQTIHWRGARIEQFTGPGWRFGHWRCPTSALAFREDNVSGSDALLIFPRFPVAVAHDSRPEVVCNAHHMVMRNPEGRYRMRALTPHGDACSWVALDDDHLTALQTELPGLERPFVEERVRVGPELFLAQRRLFRDLRGWPDALAVAEGVAELVAAAVGDIARRVRSGRPLVRAAETVLSQTFTQRLTLHEIAAAVGCSPWHLARVFRREAGTTLHRYRDQLRLRAAVDRLRDPGLDLTTLALDLGYSSHSHFTDRFRGAYGVPPSAVR